MPAPFPTSITPLDYDDAGARLSGVLARPQADDDSARPGVLVFHEAWGVNDYTVRRARMLAEMGYVALAADLFGQRYGPTQMQEAMGQTRHFREQVSALRQRAEAGRQALTRQPGVDARRLAAIGFCFGGTAALELARSGAELRAAVSFHGTLSSAAPAHEAGQIRASILVCTGADDTMIPPAQVTAFQAEMTAARADYQILILGGAVHSFTNPEADALNMPGVAYHAASERRAWRAMRDLFADTLA